MASVQSCKLSQCLIALTARKLYHIFKLNLFNFSFNTLDLIFTERQEISPLSVIFYMCRYLHTVSNSFLSFLFDKL